METTAVIARQFRWDERSGRYRNPENGQYISRIQVRDFLEESLRQSGAATDTLSQLVSDGILSPGDWRVAMREELKRETIRQYMLGAGGQHSMTQADWGSVGGMLSEQYKYLDGFYEAVASGNLTEAQIRARARMYANAAREAYERANERTARRLGYDEILWSLGLTEESCGDCQSFADMGWQSMEPDPYGGARPGSGDTECLTSCRCSTSYRKSNSSTVY